MWKANGQKIVFPISIKTKWVAGKVFSDTICLNQSAILKKRIKGWYQIN